MTFRIAQISDTHLSDAKPFFVENFQRIGEAIRQSRPHLVLNSGDISLDGAGSLPGDADGDLAAAHRLHNEIGLPLRFLPGNHDIGDSQDAPSHGEGTIDDARRARYRKHFGEEWWSFDVVGWRVLGINAQLLGSDLADAQAQDQAIDKAVATLGGRRLALFVHKPLFDQSPDEDAITGRFLNPVPRRELLEKLADVPLALVGCGHIHQFRETMAGGTHHVWCPSTGFTVPDHRQPRYGLKQVGYVEHRLHEDGAHDCRFVRVSGVADLDIGDYPQAYGQL
jgi:3',5'-cyclic AMP phosphodiesterase CpdA